MPRHSNRGTSVLSGLKWRIPDGNVWRVYVTTFALGVAYGTALSVLALRLDARGDS